MTSIFSLLIPAVTQVINYGQKLLIDVSPQQFCRKPFQDEAITPINHPAYQYGHLGLYPERIANLMHLPRDSVKSPEGFFDLFKKGGVCHDDEQGNIYPAMPIICDHFFKSHAAILELLKGIPDQAYFENNVEEATRDRFATVGSFVIYLLTAHANTHFGQIYAWRRCMGLGSVA